MAGFLAGQPWIRLGISAAIFAAMVGWEVAAPRRAHAIGRWVRGPNNLCVVVVHTILLRVRPRAPSDGVAFDGEVQGWGLRNNQALPPWRAVIAAVIVLDL